MSPAPSPLGACAAPALDLPALLLGFAAALLLGGALLDVLQVL
ncbi:MAG: hypothetical protein AB7N76_28900 [Planctomycetota bacterium]